ncbi:uncharacterized protein C8orf88 homolog [Discoglossus pictus]
MDKKKLIRKSLQPARPIRRCSGENAPVFMVNFRAEFTGCFSKDVQDQVHLWNTFNKLHGALVDSVLPNQATNQKVDSRFEPSSPFINGHLCTGRITYTRDSLIQLSGLSVSRQKPQYLPDLPVVLEKPLSNRPHGFGAIQRMKVSI